MKKVLVATDGSKTANKAIREAKELAEDRGYEVVIMNIIGNLSILPHLKTKENILKMEEASEDLKKKSSLILEEALKIFEDFPQKVSTVSRIGDPVDEILKESENCDLIIMGSRGLGRVSRTLLGSVSNRVLNKTHKNIMIVK